VIVGLGFKSALVPFHQWTPDVYQGAPTNVTAFMASVSKIAAFGALYRVLASTTSVQEYWFPVLTWMAILTMVAGNVYAIAQKDVKRILGYSSVAHAGYVLVALLAHVKAPDVVPLNAVAFYLFAYSLMTIGAFAVVTLAVKGGKEHTRLQDLNGLWQKSPFAAGCLALFMFSLVGIPPTAGFFGKYMIFVGAIDAGLLPLAYVLAASSAVSVYYYLAIVRASWVEEEGIAASEKSKLSPGLAVACAVCAIGVLGTMVFAKRVMEALDVPNHRLIENADFTIEPYDQEKIIVMPVGDGPKE
jgi:NADH-quinone oxidoreductase subunit N